MRNALGRRAVITTKSVRNRAARERLLYHVPISLWDVPRVVAVGITSPSQSMNAALAAEGLALDLTEAAVLFCSLFAVTSKDRSRAQEVCRASYGLAA